jgi:hypothetical protein
VTGELGGGTSENTAVIQRRSSCFQCWWLYSAPAMPSSCSPSRNSRETAAGSTSIDALAQRPGKSLAKLLGATTVVGRREDPDDGAVAQDPAEGIGSGMAVTLERARAAALGNPAAGRRLARGGRRRATHA